MRRIKHIVIHCTATIECKEFGVEDVRRWHKQRGFKDIGYHYLIGVNGEVWKGREDNVIGAHVKGYNRNSIGISYVGGLDNNLAPKDTRTPEQIKSLKRLLTNLKKQYPEAEILGHRDFSKDLNGNGVIEPFEFMKVCPCFDAKDEYGDL